MVLHHEIRPVDFSIVVGLATSNLYTSGMNQPPDKKNEATIGRVTSTGGEQGRYEVTAR
ncbi:hypothetical protein Poly41_27720 [Novipirellula artificiosorum]|uniref:Uncharacterized protein n=1 Tax=Novipirellula artificiosorum TaxID=2528016 RepID=A0A5C6DTE2_9BACT|nr:hypothetical protein Poly41_27720 [Novipirellula artificiosorum]